MTISLYVSSNQLQQSLNQNKRLSKNGISTYRSYQCNHNFLHCLKTETQKY